MHGSASERLLNVHSLAAVVLCTQRMQLQARNPPAPACRTCRRRAARCSAAAPAGWPAPAPTGTGSTPGRPRSPQPPCRAPPGTRWPPAPAAAAAGHSASCVPRGVRLRSCCSCGGAEGASGAPPLLRAGGRGHRLAGGLIGAGTCCLGAWMTRGRWEQGMRLIRGGRPFVCSCWGRAQQQGGNRRTLRQSLRQRKAIC